MGEEFLAWDTMFPQLERAPGLSLLGPACPRCSPGGVRGTGKVLEPYELSILSFQDSET